MSKGFWAVVAAIAIVFGGILFFKGHNGNAPAGSQPTNHIEGSSPKNVTLVEYGDYQCPYCEQYYPVVKQVAEKYKDQVKFQFRNLPLSQVHQNAFAGARAAEAAGLQNKFWEMHDMLYENQGQWVNASNPTDVFNQFAQSLKLNVTKFKEDFSSAQVNNSINADIAEFNKTKKEMATPTFFLNGEQINPSLAFTDESKSAVNVPASVDAFSKLLDLKLGNQTTTETPGGSQNPR